MRLWLSDWLLHGATRNALAADRHRTLSHPAGRIAQTPSNQVPLEA